MLPIVYVSPSEPDRIALDLANHADMVEPQRNYPIDYEFTSAYIPSNGRRVLVERKEVRDLLNSMFHATTESAGEPLLIYQMRRLASFTNRDTLKVLLIEGTLGNRNGFIYVYGHPTRVAFNALDNLLTVIQRWGIVVAHSSSIAHTANRLASIAENWFSVKDKSPIIALPEAPTLHLRTLMTFPGVGYKRAKKLLDEAGDLETALNALIAGTAQLGKATDIKIQEYLRG